MTNQRTAIIPTVLICAISGVIMFANLGGAKLWDRDEPRNARCAAEMLERNDWIVPTFNSELRTHKPILFYWLTMLAYQGWGVSEFSARFWSAAFGVGTTCLTYWIGRKLFDAQTGLFSAAILCTTLMFNVASRAATPDASLIFFCTLSFAIFVYCAFLPKSTCANGSANFPVLGELGRWSWFGIYAAMSIAVLAKGPVGIVLPMAVLGAFLIGYKARMSPVDTEPLAIRGISQQGKSPRIGNRWSMFAAPARRSARVFVATLRPKNLVNAFLLMKPWMAVFALLLIAAPWYVAVGFKTNGEWLRGFFWEHNVGRAMSSMEGHQGSFFFYYPITIVVGMFPWSVFLVPVCLKFLGFLKLRALSEAHWFLLCWTGIFVLAFSMARTKLPSYVTPTYPAVSLLFANCLIGILRDLRPVQHKWLMRASICLAGLGVMGGVAIAYSLDRYLPNDAGLVVVGMVPLTTGLIACFVLQRENAERFFQIHFFGAVTFCIFLFAWILPRLSSHQQMDELFVFLRSCKESPVVSYISQEPSWVFYSGSRIPHLGKSQKDEAVLHLKQKNGFLITTDQGLEELAKASELDFIICKSIDYFLREQRIHLVRAVPILVERRKLKR